MYHVPAPTAGEPATPDAVHSGEQALGEPEQSVVPWSSKA